MRIDRFETTMAPRRVAARSADLLIALALCGSLLVGCASAPPKPESMRDPQANFASYRTYGWTGGGTATAGAPGAAPVGLLDSQLRAAISGELQKRGYTEAPMGATPDLRISYETAAQDKIENNPVRIGIGVGGYGSNGGGSVGVGSSSVRNVREGTLVIHAIETARNVEVWQGRFAAKMKGGVDQARVNSAVATTMQDFPAQGK